MGAKTQAFLSLILEHERHGSLRLPRRPLDERMGAGCFTNIEARLRSVLKRISDEPRELIKSHNGEILCAVNLISRKFMLQCMML
jgi:hypothetical protein